MIALLRRRLREAAAPIEPPAEHGGYRNAATYGVAVNLNAEHLDAVIEACLALAERDYDADGERHGAIARSLLAGALRDWCDQIANAGDLTPLAAHLVQVGLAEVNWDELATRAMERTS